MHKSECSCTTSKHRDRFKIASAKGMCDKCKADKIEADKLSRAAANRKFDCTTKLVPTLSLYAQTPQAKRKRERKEKTDNLLEDIRLKKELGDLGE